MGASLTTATNILKEIYEPRIRDQLQDWNKASKRIEQTSEGVSSEVGGKYVVFPIHVGRNQGLGARLEMEQLPTAGNQSYKRAQVSLAYEYGAIRLSGQSIDLADSNFQAFASVLDEEVNGIQRDVSRDWNRQVFGTSVGALGTSTATYTANTITLTNTQYLEVGQVVDIFASDATTNKATGRNITAVVKNTSITVDGAAIASGAVGDIICRTGSINREIIGFGQIIANSGALFGVDPATTPLWASVQDANGGTNRPLSETMMIKMIDDIYTNGGNTTAMFTTLGVRRSYFNLLVQQRRYSDTTEFDGGFKGLAFTTDNGDVPLITDVDCQPNRIYFVNEKEIKIYREGDWSFMDRDGSKWQRVIGFDAYDATLYKYAQMGTHRRNSHGIMLDLTES